MSEAHTIINWNFVLPKNCNPVDLFLVSLTQQLNSLNQNEKLHIILDARKVNSIGLQNKMKMDAYWRRYKKLLNERLYYSTLYVNTDEQKKKLDKIYKSSKSCTTPYRIILESELSNYLNNETQDISEIMETSNNIVTST
jgi:hypothetical protein